MRLFFSATLALLLCSLTSMTLAEPTSVTAATPSTLATLATLRPSHPRLIFTPEVEASLKLRIKADPLVAEYVEKIRRRSDKLAALPPVPFTPIVPFGEFGMQMLEVSRAIQERVVIHGFMYRLTGQRVYADRLWREMETALSYPTWNPAHILDAAEMLVAVGFAYDWAYDAWTPEQRATLRQAMIQRALNRMLEIHATHEGLSSAFPTTTSNWNSVGNAGMLAGTLAMAEDEPELARRAVAYALPSLEYPKSNFEPDGASDEGATYWGYGTAFYTLAASMLNSAIGSDNGLLNGKAIAGTTLFRLHVQAPNGRNFNYGDCWPSSGPSLGYTILANRYGPSAARQHTRTLLASYIRGNLDNDSTAHRLDPLITLWLPAEQTASDLNNVALDAFFGGTANLSMMRSSWTDPRAAYLGFKAGHVDHSHNHLDAGSFVFDRAGVRWSTDLGVESYGLPGYFRKESNPSLPLNEETRDLPNRWSYYRLTNYSHSTLTLGGDLQSRTAIAPFIATGSVPAFAFSVADMSQVYPGRVQSWSRGIALVDRTWVAVRDELKGLQKDVAADWGMMTEAKVTVAQDGRSAVLKRDGETLLFTLVNAPANARISAAPALPKTKQENQNAGVTRISVGWRAASNDEVIEVHLVPSAFQGGTKEIGSLDGWMARK